MTVNNISEIQEIIIHPIFKKAFVSAEHPEGELEYSFDALGRDCMIVKFDGKWTKMYQGDGSKNEDWYGYNEEVLAPFDGVIESCNECLTVNIPGSHQNDQASHIRFRRNDGACVGYGHVSNIQVSNGDYVTAGQVIARVGNNGTSWMPHIHIGAWKENEPLQIRFDLRLMGLLMKEQGDSYFK